MTDATNSTFRTGDPRLQWLFLDLNSYFASVEQELRPELRDRPLAVVPLVADTTCCIAASYEAKQYGVRTGTQVGEAKRLCPAIVLVEARHELYVDYHHRVVEAVESCLPVTSVMSIDEMACRLLGREQPLLAALELARDVKAAVRRKVGSTLRCSVGLATNRYLSKVASDMEKPDGLVALTPDLLHDALSALTPRDLPGVGARMEKRLHQAGIQTMQQLLALDREQHAHGVGRDRWRKAVALAARRGLWRRRAGAREIHRPLPCFVAGAAHSGGCLRGGQQAAAQSCDAAAQGAPVGLAYDLDHTFLGRRARPPPPRIPPAFISSRGRKAARCSNARTTRPCWRACSAYGSQSPAGKGQKKPFFVGVTLGNLVPDHLHTLSLFSGLEEEAKRTRLSTTMDQVNYKYGTTKLCFASTLLAGAAAPTRIAFSSIPDLF